jgi:hypothetical protein
VLPIASIIGVVLVRRLPEIRAWALGAWTFLILTMGPVIHGTSIPLPFALVRRLPGLPHFRFPYRLQMGAVLGAAIALGVLLAQLRTRMPRRRYTLVFAGIVVVTLCDLVGNRVASGFPLRPEPPREPVYDVIGRDHRDCLLLEIPVAVRTGTDRIGRWTDTPGEALTFYQPTHEKRLINGFAARAPTAALEYYRASPALMFLAEEDPPPGDVLLDLRQKFVELDVGYVVVHPEMLQAGRLPTVLRVLDQVGGLQRLPDTGSLIAFRRTIDR